MTKSFTIYEYNWNSCKRYTYETVRINCNGYCYGTFVLQSCYVIYIYIKVKRHYFKRKRSFSNISCH